MRAMRAKRAMKPERAKRAMRAMRAMKGDVAVAIGPAGGAELVSVREKT